MNATLIYRITAVVFVLFAAGHTYGSLTFRPPTPEARAVLEGMYSAQFQANGATLSLGGFYKGLALSATVSLLFNAFLAWYLGTLARSNPGVIGPLGWVFMSTQLVSLALTWMFFSAVPASFCLLTAMLLGWAAWRAPRTA